MAKPIRIDSNLIQRNSIDTPIAELNNHTLREVFGNRNMAMPDLTGKEYLGDGWYSIYNKDISEFKYNVKSGVFHSKTKDVGSGGFGMVQNFRVELGTYTLSVNSDNKDQSFYIATLDENGNYDSAIYANHYNGGKHTEFVFENITGVSLYSYETHSTETKFTIQLEKGAVATSYQLPTDGPYNELNVGALGLTSQQMDYWFNVYQQRKAASLMSENFFSGSLGKGWSLKTTPDNTSNLEVDNLLVRNTLRTHIFQKDVIKATNGQLYVSDSGVVDSINTATSTIYFKIDKSATFSVNDQLKIKDVNDTGVIQTITFTISSVGAEANGAQAYTYSTGVNMTAIQSGMTAVRVSGGAVLIDASTANSPFIDVLNNGTVKARLGNLAGIAGASGYGLWSDNVFLTGKITANSGAIGGWTINEASLSAGTTTLTSDGSINLSDKFTWDGTNLLIGEPEGPRFTYDPTNGFKFYGVLSQENLDTSLKDELKGEDGANGTDGTDGLNAYLHIAYSNSTDGSVDFSTTAFDTATYIGTYTDFNATDSEVYTDYNWVLIKGADGADGSDGVNGQSSYLHIAWANSADGSVDFSTTVSAGKSYIGTYTDFVEADSELYGDYDWTLIKGADGSNGSDGVNGESAYLHIAYSTSSDGSADFSTTVFESAVYMGTYTDFTETDSTDYTDYKWVKIRGNDGANGTDGTDGQSMYLHIAYATNATGSTGFSLTYTGTQTYIGTYTDTTITDSTNPTKYNWKLFKGTDGQDGTDGTSVVLKGSVATVGNLPSGAAVGDLYVVLADGDGYVWNGSAWDDVGQIQGPPGEDGIDGNDGATTYVHYAYATSPNGSTGFSLTPFVGALYLGIYTDFTLADSTEPADYDWALIKGADGADGVDGVDGNNGLNAYIHYAYATSSDGSVGFSTTYTGTETYVGWYTDFTQADSTTYTDYDWVLFTGQDGIDGIDGADGENGLPAYIHYAYATASNGSVGFTTTYTGVETYVGWYSDFTEADSNIYTDYEWALFKGADGADGKNGLTAYIHYAYATSSNGAYGFSTTYTGVQRYVGWYTDFTASDSTNYTDYEWQLFKGADGLNGSNGNDGLNAYVHYAYARSSDGSQGFTLEYTGVETYVGWYTDFTAADSSTYTDYEWQLFKGADGVDGLNAFIHYAYANNANGTSGFSLTYTGGQTYVGWYTDFSSIDSTNPADYEWSRFKGLDGASGPGLIYRGLYSSIKVYYANADRRDVVQYGGNYYAANAAYSPITGTWNSAKWTQMNYFSSVATDILLANDASINKTLIIGDGTTGALRSYTMDSINDPDGVGFYLDGMTGNMTLGDNAGQNLKWNGGALSIKGNITADNLSLTNNAAITKRLTIGSYSEKGSIASYGMSSLTGATGGFYMDGGGSFIFGKYGRKHISWDGNELKIVDKLYETSIEQGAEFSFTIKGKNNTNSPIAWYYKKWPLVGYSEPTTWTYIGSISAESQSSTTITSMPVNGYNWNYKVRFGTTADYIYEPELTLNHYGEYSSGLSNVYSAISGGSMTDITKKRIPWNVSGYNYTGAAYLSIISGTILVTSTTGTATVTLADNITSATGVASPYSNDSAGSGGDFAYMQISPYTTNSFTVTKDYTGTSTSRYISFIIIGMEG